MHCSVRCASRGQRPSQQCHACARATECHTLQANRVHRCDTMPDRIAMHSHHTLSVHRRTWRPLPIQHAEGLSEAEGSCVDPRHSKRRAFDSTSGSAGAGCSLHTAHHASSCMVVSPVRVTMGLRDILPYSLYSPPLCGHCGSQRRRSQRCERACAQSWCSHGLLGR